MPRERQIAAHIGYIFLIAAAVFLTAMGLQLIEHLATNFHAPGWLLFGMRAVSFCLFLIDAVLLIGSSAIMAIHLLNMLWRDKP